MNMGLFLRYDRLPQRGFNMKAQGNALGQGVGTGKALKGRNIKRCYPFRFTNHQPLMTMYKTAA